MELLGHYENGLKKLGVIKVINQTRLKHQILCQFPHCKEETDGRNTLLVIKQGLKNLLRDTLESNNVETEVLLVSKVAKIIRKEMHNWKRPSFNGQFAADCQRESVPPLLRHLVCMLINGQDLTTHESQASLSISQLIHFNAKGNHCETSKMRHNKDQEPPLPIYFI